LTDHVDFGHGAAVETAFHRGEGYRLILRHFFGVHVAGGERHDHGGQQADDAAGLKKERGLFGVSVAQGVKRADGGHHE
jgi:hypothetical protein